MEVDPNALWAWAQWLNGISAEVKNLGNQFASAATNDPFPGTDLRASINDSTDQVKSALTSFSSRPAEMAQIAKGTGDRFHIEDTDFANQLRAMGGLP